MGLRAQRMYTSRILDADSNEPLPFAQVYVSEGRGAVANYEGAFTIIAEADELLRISYVGYSSQQIRAAELPSIIRLKPLSTQMREVTVTPVQPLLVRASKKLYAEYKRFKNEQSTFFLRMREDLFLDSVTWAGHKAQMTEAFIRGCAVGNLRSPVAVTGYRSGWAIPHLWGSGYQWIQLGVMMMGDEIHLVSKDVITPLHPKASKRYYEKYYHITYSSFTDEDGRALLRIHFRRWDDVTKPILVGTLIMNRTTLEPLSFDGVLCNTTFLLNVNEYLALETVRPRIHIDYTQEHGYTEVSDVYARNAMSKLDQHYTMVNVGNLQLPTGVMVDKNNMWTAIDSAGFDVDFWTRHETVARTADEQALFNLKSSGDEQAFQLESLDFVPEEKKSQAAEDRRRRDSIAMSRIRGVLIVDTLTRKAIPFAEIQVSGKARTMSNLQGFFLLDVDAADTLLIKANGYEEKRLPMSQLQRTVRLDAMRKEKHPPQIQIDELLALLGTKIMEEEQTYSGMRAPFFLRRVRILDRDTLMTEAMINAASALTVSDPKVLIGQHYVAVHNDSLRDDDFTLKGPARADSMIMQILSRESLRSNETSNWRQQKRDAANRGYEKMAAKKGDFNRPFVPLVGTGRTRHYRRHYDLSTEMLSDIQGRSYLRIRFDKKPNWRYPVVTGEMLVDLDSLHILSFDGRLQGSLVVHGRTRRDLHQANIRPAVFIHYDFRHDHGFTEVWHAGFHTSARDESLKNFTEEWYVLMNCSGVPDNDLITTKQRILRLYDEELLLNRTRLPLNDLIPPLITFDIFSEKADWKWIM